MIAGKIALDAGPERIVTTTAPAMMNAKRPADMGVSLGKIRNHRGSTNPTPPKVSTTPMKYKKAAGMPLCFVISSIGIKNFETPANKNSGASRI